MELSEIERTKPRPSLQETAKAMSVMAAAARTPHGDTAVVKIARTFWNDADCA